MHELWARLLVEGFAAPAALPLLQRLSARVAEGDTGMTLRAAEAEILLASGLAERPPASRGAPLVLDGDWLCTRRVWQHEQRLAEQLQRRAAELPPAVDAAELAAAFPPAPDDAPFAVREALAAARRAAELACRHGLTLLLGGPGCGKTTLAARLIALLARTAQQRGRPLPLVVLAAPTGKAAARLAEALGEGLRAAGLDAAACAALTAWSSTLHRLAMSRTLQSPDWAVIDEASMADAALLDQALARLPPSCRVLLLGDPDQLASVEPGRVLSDLALLPPTHPLARCTARLSYNWRAREAPALAATIAALQRGDDEAALASFVPPAASDGVSQEELPGSPAALIAALQARHSAWLAAWRAASAPEDCLALLPRLRLISVLRQGPWGCEALNALWEQQLAGLRAGLPYRGRPVLITANRPELGVANGDLGVCWPEGAGWAVHLATPGGVRVLPLHRLPRLQPAWFLTVHQAQGSQGEAIEVIGLPPLANEAQRRLATREMVYTAVTRAQRRAWLWWDEAGLRQALAQRESARRRSGLRQRLSASP
ncbi:MAG: AAA family ATPase [Planctomycetota bacterium]|nr:AAA family ATPase [Planctomycetota bacterium]MDW8372235.1 AAA family ATPase [Planctomycetota bacterium]